MGVWYVYLHTESDELVTHGTNQILEDAHTLVELKMLADMVIEWVTQLRMLAAVEWTK